MPYDMRWGFFAFCRSSQSCDWEVTRSVILIFDLWQRRIKILTRPYLKTFRLDLYHRLSQIELSSRRSGNVKKTSPCS